MEDDRPEPVWTCWNHWIAVPTGDQAGVMEVLGLTPQRPVTFAEANEIIDADAHGEPDDDVHLTRVFVTPELDGWTLVIGSWCDPCDGERSGEVLRLCTMLSDRYGRAQAYYYGAQGDGSAWLVAENGAVVRRYSATGEPEDASLTLGEPLRQENARRAELRLPGWDAEWSEDDEDEWKWAVFDMAPEIAAALGVCPLDITPETSVRGTGVLALTRYAADWKPRLS